MKKSLTILAISFVATALTDVTLAFKSSTLTFITAGLVFFLAGFLFYDRIREKIILNSLLVFFFLIALILFAYRVNPQAHTMWNFIIAASLVGYVAGMISKILRPA